MKITHVDVIPVRVPMRPNTLNSPEFPDEALDNFDKVPKFIIKVHTDGGIVGLGESSRGESHEAMAQAARALVGTEPLKMNVREFSAGPDASGAFEMALYDLLGKHFGWPVHQLLGGACRDRVAVDYWMGRTTPEEGAARARHAHELGFHGIKMKIRQGDPVVERVRAIAEAVPGMEIVADANQHFHDPEEMIAIARSLEDCKLVLESPLPQDRLDWYVRFRKETRIPVALHLGSPRALVEAIRLGATDYVNLGGGMPEFVRAAYAADLAGIACWHGSGVDLGIRDASYLHACAAAPGCTLASDILSYLRSDDLVTEGLRIVDGHALVPQGPGLGVALDEDALDRYRVG